MLLLLLTLATALAVVANDGDTTTTHTSTTTICPPPLHKLSTMSWNLAAINNNPFEYHLGGTTPSHNLLMSEVANFLTKKNKNDPYLSDLFPPYMVEDLLSRM